MVSPLAMEPIAAAFEAAGRDPSDLLSYLLFDDEYAHDLIALGESDARRCEDALSAFLQDNQAQGGPAALSRGDELVRKLMGGFNGVFYVADAATARDPEGRFIHPSRQPPRRWCARQYFDAG